MGDAERPSILTASLSIEILPASIPGQPSREPQLVDVTARIRTQVWGCHHLALLLRLDVVEINCP